MGGYETYTRKGLQRFKKTVTMRTIKNLTALVFFRSISDKIVSSKSMIPTKKLI